jgi:peptidoglycan/LPS O-acetylase OafA/YrhL
VLLALSLPVTRAALTAGGNEIWVEKAYLPGMSAIAVGVVTAMLARRIQVPSRRVVWVMGLVGWAGVCAVLFAGSWVWKFLHHGYGLFLAVAAAGIVLSTHWSETAGRGTAQVRGLIWLGSCGRLSCEVYLSHMFCVFGGLALFNWIGPGGPWRFLWYPPILEVCWLLGSILSCRFAGEIYDRFGSKAVLTTGRICQVRAIRRIRPMTVLSGGRNGYLRGVGVPHAKYSIAYLRHGCGSSLLISAGALTIEPTSHPEAERGRFCESTPSSCDIAKVVILWSRSALQS